MLLFAMNNGAIEVTIYINDQPFLWCIVSLEWLSGLVVSTVSDSKFVQLSIDPRFHHSVVLPSYGRLAMRRINPRLRLYLTFDIHSLRSSNAIRLCSLGTASVGTLPRLAFSVHPPAPSREFPVTKRLQRRIPGY